MNKHKRRWINTGNQRKGQDTEQTIANRLRYCGFLRVAKIASPMMKAGKIKHGGKLITLWKHASRVAGDFYCAHPSTGQMVLIEVKSRKGKLPFSALEQHQVRRLDQHAEEPTRAMLVWYDSETARVYLMPWPIVGFGPGVSLTPAQAELASIERAEDWGADHG